MLESLAKILFSHPFVSKIGCKLEKLFNSCILAPFIASFFGIKLMPVGKEFYFLECFRYKLLIPKDSLLLAIKILKQNAYEEVYRLRGGDVVVDVGAHVGIFSIKAGFEVRERGIVVAIEPEPRNYVLLKYNVKLNDLESVVMTINKACGSCHAKTKLYLASSSRSHSINRPYLQKYVEVELDTLDNITESLRLKGVNFLKIDVEGNELEVIRGARETIKRSQDLKLAVEVHIGQVNFKDVYKNILTLGLHIKYINKELSNRPVIYAEKSLY